MFKVGVRGKCCNYFIFYFTSETTEEISSSYLRGIE